MVAAVVGMCFCTNKSGVQSMNSGHEQNGEQRYRDEYLNEGKSSLCPTR